jgi:hypothetical protein
VLDSLCADQPIGKSADRRGLASHNQNFKAVVMVEMNVQR